MTAGGERSHAAGIQSLVVVKRALVILTRNHRHDRLAVGERQHRAFGTGEKLLDDDVISRRAEGFLGHYLFERVLRPGVIGSDQRPFAQRQSVGLYHDWIDSALFDVRKRLPGIVKRLV